ncbi:hypothetical protein HPB47_025386, partial [Ixodes persulcatus]
MNGTFPVGEFLIRRSRRLYSGGITLGGVLFREMAEVADDAHFFSPPLPGSSPCRLLPVASLPAAHRVLASFQCLTETPGSRRRTSMALLSKYAQLLEYHLPYNCYEIGHTWTPHCSEASVYVGLNAFKESLKMYLPLYA